MGIGESKDSWRELLLHLQDSGLKDVPALAIGDGSLGLWGAINEIAPNTKHQRCWVHKTANILDKLPKSQQEKAKAMIHDIYLAATKADAITAWDMHNYQLKYPKAVECLAKDQIVCVFKLIIEAEPKCLCGKNRIAQVINLDKFIDGIHQDEIPIDGNLNKVA